MDIEVFGWIIAFLVLISASVHWGRWRKRMVNAEIEKLHHTYGFNPITSTTRQKLYPNTGGFEKETRSYRISFFLMGSLGGMVDIRLKSPLRPPVVILKTSPIAHTSSRTSPLTKLMMKDLIRIKTGNTVFDQTMKLYTKESSQISYLLTPEVISKLLKAAANDDFFLMTEHIISSYVFYPELIKSISKLSILAEELVRIK